MFPSVLPKFFFCAHELFSHCGDDFVFALQTGFELLNSLRPQISFARTGRAVESRRSILKEGFLPLVKQRGVDLVLVADGRDRLAFNQVEFEQPDFLLSGVLAARAGGLVVFRIHGRIGCPTIAYLSMSNRTFRRGRDRLFACEYLLHPEKSALRSDVEAAQFFGVILGIYGVLTWLLFRVRKMTFGLSPMQLRVGWIGAFILGAVGTPLIYELALV